jgi:hypothetical protein
MARALSRYTHRVTISNRRLVSVDEKGVTPRLLLPSERTRLEKHAPLANQRMATSLFAKYDYRFEYGDGGHNGKNGKHGGAILLESLRWQWRDYAQ